jgi:N-ethylmaleimide reductase
VENRARLLLEVLDATVAVWGADRVGIRISPLNSFNSMKDSDPIATFSWLAGKLNDYHLAYLHVMRADFTSEQQGDVMTPIRSIYQGAIVGNMGYSAAEAEAAIADGQIDAVAFGVPFLANPDLPDRFAKNAPLNAPDPTKFYSSGAAGYTDYPYLT